MMERNYKLINAMEEAGVNCCSLARRVGIERKAIQRHTHGGTPNVSNAILIARTLGKRVEDLWDAEPKSVYKGD